MRVLKESNHLATSYLSIYLTHLQAIILIYASLPSNQPPEQALSLQHLAALRLRFFLSRSTPSHVFPPIRESPIQRARTDE